MATTHIVKRGIVGLTLAALASGCLGLAGLGLASTAQARPTWCGIFHPMPLDIPSTPPPPNPPECVGFFPLPGVDPSHCVI